LRREEWKMAYVRQIEPAEATGEIKEFYDKLIERDGCVRGIFKLSSLRPSVLFGLSALYEAVFYGPSGLSRAQREMVAIVVSAVNGCDY
jgi:alkylhydroperoxidase family enzyme